MTTYITDEYKLLTSCNKKIWYNQTLLEGTSVPSFFCLINSYMENTDTYEDGRWNWYGEAEEELEENKNGNS